MPSFSAKFATFFFAMFLIISPDIPSISAADVAPPPPAAPVVDKESLATINEFIEMGQKIAKNPNAAPNLKETKEMQKKWFDQEDFDKDGQVTVDESVKYMMEKMLPVMMAMAMDKKNGDKMIGMMREMASGQMALMDTNGDVRLSRAEFETAFAKMFEGIVADAKKKHGGK